MLEQVSKLVKSAEGHFHGEQWSEPQIVSYRAGFSSQNPLLYYDGDEDRVFLLHTMQQVKKGQGTAIVVLMSSRDRSEFQNIFFYQPKVAQKPSILD